MTMLMLVGKMITALHIWAMDIPVEEVVVSGAVAGEVVTMASLITNRTEAITRRHLFMLQPEVGNLTFILNCKSFWVF